MDEKLKGFDSIPDDELDKVSGGALDDVNTYTITLGDMILSKNAHKQGKECAVWDFANNCPKK